MNAGICFCLCFAVILSVAKDPCIYDATTLNAVSLDKKMNILRRYFYWTYDRGSFHYDVMVTFILAFIFITPHFINYKDKPAESIPLQASQVMVKAETADSMIFEIRAADVANTHSDDERHEAMLHVIEPIAGTVEISRDQPIVDANGRTVAYKVWVTR